MRQRGPVGLRHQLEDRVDRHRLDSGHRIELLAAHTLVDTLIHAVRAPVAIMERQTEQVRGAVEQAVIASPGVDPDAAQRPLRRRERKPLERVGEEPKDVPVQAVRQANRAVGEAMDNIK